MNKDELIQLKKEILGNDKKYVAMWFQEFRYKIMSEPMTLEEIKAKADTTSVAKQYENVIESAIKNLSHDGKDVAVMNVPGPDIIFVEENIAEKLMALASDADEAWRSKVRISDQREILDAHAIDIREYVKYHFDGNILTDYSMIYKKGSDVYYSTCQDSPGDLESGFSDEIEVESELGGIINLSQFETLMNNLGYSLDHYRKDGTMNIDADYVSDLITGTCWQMYLVRVDLTKQNKRNTL